LSLASVSQAGSRAGSKLESHILEVMQNLWTSIRRHTHCALCLILLCCSVSAALAALEATERILPVPAHSEAGAGFLLVHNGFRTLHAGPDDPYIDQLLDRFSRRLSERTGVRLLAPRTDQRHTALLRVETSEATPAYPDYGVDEAYQLEISSEFALLRARHGYGLCHGLETLLQLLETRAEGQGFAAATIRDQPRFGWRGLQIDPVRHFLPVPVVKRQLDAMAAVKLNVLHILFSNAQGFRMESKRYPKLHELGGEGVFYSQDEMRDLVEYARLRGIRVVPDFGVPTHIASWLVGYPELSSRPGRHLPIRSFGIFEPAFNPTLDSTYEFLDNLYGEMASIFPDQYLHIGGDELTGKHWSQNPQIQAYMKREGIPSTADLQVHFTKRLLPIVERHGKKAIGWDEVLHPDLPPTILVQSWQGQDALTETVRRGNQGILSAGFYLDLMLPASDHYRTDPHSGTAASLSADEARRILGGEACSWAEFISAENLEVKLWPRLAAIAERLWSPAGTTDEAYLYARFPALMNQLRWLGVDPENVQRQMLRRALPANVNLDAVQEWLWAFEPVKRYLRADSGSYTVFTPLNRMVDLLWPESLPARDLREQLAMAGRTRDAASIASVRARLLRWQALQPQAIKALQGSALMADGMEAAREAEAACALLLEGLEWLESGENPPEDWLASAREHVATWKQQKREILNMLVTPLESMLEAISAPAG
jgi:hexosaminidase